MRRGRRQRWSLTGAPFDADSGSGLVADSARRCLSFGGVNEYISVDGVAPELATSQAWTVSFWMRHPGPTATGQNLFNINTSAGGNVTNQTFLGATNYIAVFGGSSWVTAGRVNTTNVLDGNWHHILVAVNHTANRLDWYVDGVLEQGAGSTVFPALNSDDLVTIGAEWDSPGPTVGNFWGGDIVGLALWLEQLDLADLAPTLHALGPGFNLRALPNQPDRWWPLGGLGFASPLPDLMLSDDAATLSNITADDVVQTGL